MTSEERPPDDERFVEEEAEEAAAEAAGIGGRRPEYDVDESERPLEEAGEGESEGFELAEQELVANATHDPDGHGNPLLDRIDESADSGAEYGEADQEGEGTED